MPLKRNNFDCNLSMKPSILGDALIHCCVSIFFQVYHAVHMHNINPVAFLSQFRKSKNVKVCPKCAKRCFSPMVFSLHHDRHHVATPIECQACNESFLSPWIFFREDTCKKNSLPGELLKTSENIEAQLKAESSLFGVVGKVPR